MANSVSAALPQYWAMAGLRRLMELTPGVQSVNRQFSPELARAGDQVNAWRADRRTMRRMGSVPSYSATDANLTAVPVTLDQYFFDTILITDVDEAKTLPELTRVHLFPMIEAMARGIDRCVLGRVHAFLRQGSPLKRAGKLGGMTTTNAPDYILEAEEVLAGNLAPMEGLRTAIVHHTANTKLMGSDLFTKVNERGGGATVLTGEVGTVYNTRVVMSQNVNYVYAPNADTAATAINEAAGYAAGTATALTVDTGRTWTVGEYVNVAGNDQPTYITASSASTDVTLNEELKYAVADNAVVTQYLKMVNEATTRAAGYAETMTFTHNAGKNLQVGQIVSFGTTTRYDYTVVEVVSTASTTTEVYLDRPLEASVASGADAFPGPAGSLNPVLHEDAIAFVSRPMAPLGSEVGASSAVVNYRGIGIRVVMDYVIGSGAKQVNIDILAGISVLDVDLLCVMCA